MVKRTLIAIALVALLITSAQALGPEPDYKSGSGTPGNGIKVDPESMLIKWPFEYVALDLCSIPITMEVGYFVEVKECHKRKIKLIQVDCDDDQWQGDKGWPCYMDCENVQVRANFEAKLGLSLRDKASVIDKWKAYFKDHDGVISAGSGWTTVKVCVQAWKVKLINADVPANSVIPVGNVVITVKPNV